ncbi:MAG: hypothetical protein H0V43_04830, partial [Gemmatimonadales bacterium]|nr:hypothetical protein [Gemmatimonadales bacterium]
MDRIAPSRPRIIATALLSLAVAGCGSGRGNSGSVPAPAPGHSSAVPAGARAMEIPVLEGFESAVAGGTRLRTGQPGPQYWQQWSEYRLSAELNPVSKRLSGQGTIRYHNRSPDTLATVYIHLLGNLFSPRSRHNTDVPWAVEGVELGRVTAQGTELTRSGRGKGQGPGYSVNGTVMELRLPRPLTPGGKAELAIDWRLRVPPDGAPRGGQDGEVFFISYWYPQMAVYDDVNGWQIDQYLGNAEFYMGYGNYDVSLTVPEGWLVTGTGRLLNPDDVLSEQTRARLDSAARASGVVQVVGEADREPGKSTTDGRDGKLTWRFRAENVRDVAWATSAKYLWDAVPAAVGDPNGDGRADT